MESILNSVKKFLGITEDYTHFDDQLIMAINSAFFVLYQHGVGRDPSKPFVIKDDNEEWIDFIDEGDIELCKLDVCQRVRLMFDPPTSGFLVTAIENQIKEYEARMVYEDDSRKAYQDA